MRWRSTKLLATSISVLGAPCTHSGRNAGNVGSLFTCTSANLVLFRVQRFVLFYGGELLL
jgi:hypothetical protein